MNTETQQKTPITPTLDDGIDLRELFNALWKDKKSIIIITLISAILSVVYSLQLVNQYKSESILMVRSDSESSNLLSQYGGLASMAGINLPSGEDDKSSQAIKLIQSRRFVKHLLTFDNILPSIMAAKSFDPKSGKLLFSESLYDSDTKTWTRKSKEEGREKPSYLETHEKIFKESIVSISQDKKTGFISIDVEHISPIFAKEFLDLIIRESNALIRMSDLEESSKALEYLTAELSRTSFVKIQESINSLIEVQLEKQMLTQIHEDYVLTEIEPPFIPEDKSKPHRAVICIIGTLIGSFFSILYVLFRHYFYIEKNQASI